MTDMKKEIKQPSGENLSPEQKIEFSQEGIRAPERNEPTREEIISKESLQREIAKMELDDSLKKEASQRAREIETLGEGKKIEHLLEVAKDKGVAFAIKTAKEMNDPYVLDSLHDILVKEWAEYKQFLK